LTINEYNDNFQTPIECFIKQQRCLFCKATDPHDEL